MCALHVHAGNVSAPSQCGKLKTYVAPSSAEYLNLRGEVDQQACHASVCDIDLIGQDFDLVVVVADLLLQAVNNGQSYEQAVTGSTTLSGYLCDH